MPATPALYKQIYDGFQAPISRFDCGQKCAPLNNGEPVCCSTKDAVPVVDRAEWKLLKTRTKMWREWVPTDAPGRALAADLEPLCLGIECNGAQHCERDNRSMSCRTFPFFPYVTREGEFVGLAYFWAFEHLCWVVNNLQIVDREYVRQFIDNYDKLFAADKDEFEGNKDQSAAARRVFTRWNRIIPLIGRDYEFYAVEPRTHVVRRAALSEFKRTEPYAKEPPAPASKDRVLAPSK